MKFTAQLCTVLLVLWVYSSFVSCVYDYSDGPNGPANWGTFGATCATGTQQSPINITTPFVKLYNKPLDVVTKPKSIPSEIYNNGHTPTVEVLEEDVQVLTILGVQYKLRDFHFHIPSEHSFGCRTAMELHLVHRSSDGKIAVIGLLYELGSASTFLAQFFNILPPFSPPNERKKINIIFPSLKNVVSYYQYNGSLTTPPCSENVAWTVLNKIYTLSSDQFSDLRATLPEENARPIQARNGRTIYLLNK